MFIYCPNEQSLNIQKSTMFPHIISFTDKNKTVQFHTRIYEYSIIIIKLIHFCIYNMKNNTKFEILIITVFPCRILFFRNFRTWIKCSIIPNWCHYNSWFLMMRTPSMTNFYSQWFSFFIQYTWNENEFCFSTMLSLGALQIEFFSIAMILLFINLVFLERFWRIHKRFEEIIALSRLANLVIISECFGDFVFHVLQVKQVQIDSWSLFLLEISIHIPNKKSTINIHETIPFYLFMYCSFDYDFHKYRLISL